MNPDALHFAFPAGLYEQHIWNMRKFCLENNCKYLNPNLKANLLPNQFHDWSHITQRSARLAYSSELISELLSGLHEINEKL